MDNLDKEYDAVRDRIFSLLKSKSISQKDFSEMLHVSSQTITDWKKGKSRSFASKLPIIAEILETTPSWLFSGTGRQFLSSEDRKKEQEMYLSMLEKSAQKIDKEFVEVISGFAPFFALYSEPFQEMVNKAGISMDEVFEQIKNNAFKNDNLSKAEWDMVLAYRKADERTRQMVDLALEPFSPPASTETAM